jgi:hypothetical protein
LQAAVNAKKGFTCHFSYRFFDKNSWWPILKNWNFSDFQPSQLLVLASLEVSLNQNFA